MADIVIKKSKISGRGVFAGKNFKKGDIVISWSPKILKKSELKKLSENDKHFIEKVGHKYYLMQPPERYVNHSCDPNTKPLNDCDVAIRNIKKGEEITTNYSTQTINNGFECKCESKNCQKIIK